MAKGLHVSIYKNANAEFGDCSNRGLSSRHNRATLTGPNIPEIFEPSEDAPEVQLLPGNLGHGYKAVPAEHGEGAGPMFGGCFIYTSDSRFPSKQPIPLHDRWEDWDLYDRMD